MKQAARIDKKIEIPSDIGYIKKVSHELLEHLKEKGVDESVQFDIRLAVEEAVRNAIEHGNNYDKELPVLIRYSLDAKKIIVCIEDKGEGFHLKSVPDPRQEDNLLQEGGRGVFLMQKLMNKVKYSKRGNRVTMVKLFK
ncbi:MAG: ATP-binding protein [Candidatus Omnitrophota bacterium]